MGSYTPNFNLYKPAIDETGWGDEVNQNFDIIDDELTAHKILENLKTVDGADSGLDADLLDGKHASDFVPVSSDSDISISISGTQVFNISTAGILTLPKQSFIHVYMDNGKTNYSVSANTWTKVPLDTVINDIQNEFDTTNHRFTASETGVYFISAVVNIANPTDQGNYRITVYKNGASWTWWSFLGASGTGYQSLIFFIVIKLSAGDYIEVFVRGNYDFEIAYGGGNALLFIAKIA